MRVAARHTVGQRTDMVGHTVPFFLNITQISVRYVVVADARGTQVTLHVAIGHVEAALVALLYHRVHHAAIQGLEHKRAGIVATPFHTICQHIESQIVTRLHEHLQPIARLLHRVAAVAPLLLNVFEIDTLDDGPLTLSTQRPPSHARRRLPHSILLRNT